MPNYFRNLFKRKPRTEPISLSELSNDFARIAESFDIKDTIFVGAKMVRYNHTNIGQGISKWDTNYTVSIFYGPSRIILQYEDVDPYRLQRRVKEFLTNARLGESAEIPSDVHL